MKKRIAWILIIFLVTNFLVFGLYSWSQIDNSRPGSFLRFIDMHPWKSYQMIDLRYNSFYIAGSSGNNLVLGNTTSPLKYRIVSPTLDTSTKNITGALWNTTRFAAPTFFTRDNLRMIYDGNVKRIIPIDPITNVPAVVDSSLLRFTALLPLNVNSFIMKLYDDSSQQMILVKESKGKRVDTYSFQKQVDGIFCVDGQLDFDTKYQQLVYCYYYRNQVLVLDSNLRIVRSFNTIDTNTIAKIKLAPIKSQDIITLAETPKNVNKRISAHYGQVFVLSGQQSRNEESALFLNNSVIDIYDITSGKYVKSFYLPDLFGSKVKSFKVTGKQLWALYKHHLVIFYMY